MPLHPLHTLPSACRWGLLGLTAMLMLGCKPQAIKERHVMEPIREEDCHPPRVWQDNACTTPTVREGQYQVLPNMRNCTHEPGVFKTDDGKFVQQGQASEHQIFLRCIFHGGDLQVCVAHNNCQVIMNTEQCQKELAELQKIYRDIPQQWECSSLKRASS